MQKCIEAFEVLEDIPFSLMNSTISLEEQTKISCHLLHPALKCVDEFKNRCVNPFMIHNVMQAYKGYEEVARDLCNEESDLMKQLISQPCLSFTDIDDTNVCRSYKKEIKLTFKAAENKRMPLGEIKKLCW